MKSIFAILLSLFASQLLFAQQGVLITFSADDDGTEKVEEMMTLLKDSCEFRLQQRVVQMGRICELNDGQVAKLRVASKNAIQKFLKPIREKHEIRLREMQLQAGFQIDDEGKTFVPDGGEVTRFSFHLPNHSARALDEFEAWEKVVSKTLNEEQMVKLQADHKERQAKLQGAAVNFFVARADSLLFLTEEQQNELKPIIDAEVGPMLVKHMKITELLRQRGLVRRRADRDSEWREKLDGVLNTEQLDEWENSVEPLLFQMQADVMVIR